MDIIDQRDPIGIAAIEMPEQKGSNSGPLSI